MLISMNWISDFVDLGGVDLRTLINRFTLSTAEVEDVYEYGKDLRDVVAAKILTVAPHPESKKLHLLTVDAGTGEPVPIVCGAPNVRAGAPVVLVKAGGLLRGQEIKTAVLAGAESRGMCLSEKELGISDDHSGIMILDRDVKPGTPVRDFLDVEDTIFEIDNKSLTNRPDLWGHYGIAREIAALLGRPLRPVETASTGEYDALPEIPIEVKDSERCLRYTGLVIRNVRRKVSPANMRIRLFYCGMRAINLLADLTNYLMLELGQPMHAFDNALVGKITVRTFDAPIEFETLDGVKRAVAPGTLMICHGDRPVAVAGVMGGANSEISDSTDSVLLESANFNDVSVRKAEMALGLRTEASMRYEKSLDPELTVTASRRFLKLLRQIDPGVAVASRLTDVYVRRFPSIHLSIGRKFIDRYTGIDLPDETVKRTLSSLGFGVAQKGTDFEVDVPSWRATKDVTIKADLIEEITRVYGYDNFEIKSSRSLLTPVRQDPEHECEYAVKQLLAQSFALSEVHSYIWYNLRLNRELGIETKDNVKIVNSVSPECSVLRREMAPTLLNFAYQNRPNFEDFGFFEIGRTVRGLKANGSCDERKTLGILLASRSSGDRAVFSRAKSVVETLARCVKNRTPSYSPIPQESRPGWAHPYDSARVSLGGEELGYFTLLHPAVREKIDKKLAVAVIELDFGAFAALAAAPVEIKEASRFPSVEFDLSLLIGEGTPYGELAGCIDKSGCPDLAGYELVDVYEGESLGGKKSVTIRFRFSSLTRTLSGDEVEQSRQKLIALLREKGAELREA